MKYLREHIILLIEYTQYIWNIYIHGKHWFCIPAFCIFHDFMHFFTVPAKYLQEECYIFPDFTFLNFALSQNFRFIFLVLTAECVQVYLYVIVFFSDLLLVSGMANLATSHCNLHKLKLVVVLEEMWVGLKVRDIKFQVINYSP